jgi:hypothetical protein
MLTKVIHYIQISKQNIGFARMVATITSKPKSSKIIERQ